LGASADWFSFTTTFPHADSAADGLRGGDFGSRSPLRFQIGGVTPRDLEQAALSEINAIKFAKATGDLPQNINFAVKTGAMRDFLDNSAVAYQTAESKVELKTADIASKARAYTLLISCTAKSKD
jgi:hypothetical protein